MNIKESYKAHCKEIGVEAIRAGGKSANGEKAVSTSFLFGLLLFPCLPQ
jgi:hypothetical protein